MNYATAPKRSTHSFTAVEHVMDQISSVTTVDFEVHLLMTMKLRIRMSHNEAELEAKLAGFQLSVANAERMHERIADALGDEAVYFANMKNFLEFAEQDATSLKYESVLWPGFTFKASADETGRLESARYWHTGRDSSGANSPLGLAIWSLDVTEFAEQFGPVKPGRKWSPLDPLLPAYEEVEFHWAGESYGAGFSWGLFMFSAMSWD
jgi:hypothetical protein